MPPASEAVAAPSAPPDPTERAELLVSHLHSSREGLSGSEAARRLLQFGPNVLSRREGLRWPRELARQLTHPLALLLWLAGALSLAVGNVTVAVAVLLVILLNAGFAFVQELQAERAVEALTGYLPQHALTIRDGERRSVLGAELVPGDVVLLAEGDRVPADMRLLSGAVEVDLSTLTGESVPVLRSAELADRGVPRLQARDLVFSGISCTEREASGVVFATGMRTELGRIAALSERVERATTMTFAGMIAGQIGTAFAARAQSGSVEKIGAFSNRYLLLAIVAELALGAFFIYTPPLQSLLGTAALPLSDLVVLLPFPLIVWGADALRRRLARRRASPRARLDGSPVQV